ncbi:hypothetical protein MTP99_012226 [Tenebrio molitor]|nr:hypothetical protein MTP99_012226 [Tenebrio molitor]
MAVGDSAPRSRSRRQWVRISKGEDFFQGRNLRRAMDVCVCLSGADGRVVEGRATLFRHHREVSRVQIPGRMGLPWMFVLYFVLCCPERKKEKRGWAWVAGESTPEPPRT